MSLPSPLPLAGHGGGGAPSSPASPSSSNGSDPANFVFVPLARPSELPWAPYAPSSPAASSPSHSAPTSPAAAALAAAPLAAAPSSPPAFASPHVAAAAAIADAAAAASRPTPAAIRVPHVVDVDDFSAVAAASSPREIKRGSVPRPPDGPPPAYLLAGARSPSVGGGLAAAPSAPAHAPFGRGMSSAAMHAMSAAPTATMRVPEPVVASLRLNESPSRPEAKALGGAAMATVSAVGGTRLRTSCEKFSGDYNPHESTQYWADDPEVKGWRVMTVVIPFFNEQMEELRATLMNLKEAEPLLEVAKLRMHVLLVMDGWFKAHSSTQAYVEALFPSDDPQIPWSLQIEPIVDAPRSVDTFIVQRVRETKLGPNEKLRRVAPVHVNLKRPQAALDPIHPRPKIRADEKAKAERRPSSPREAHRKRSSGSPRASSPASPRYRVSVEDDGKGDAKRSPSGSSPAPKREPADVAVEPERDGHHAVSVTDHSDLMRVSLLVKRDNRRKHNSHMWFLQSFCPAYNSHFVFLTDCGTLFDRNCLPLLAQYLDDHVECAAVSGRQRVMSAKMQRTLTDAEPDDNEPMLSFAFIYRWAQCMDYEASTASFNGAFSAAGMLPVVPGPCGMYRFQHIYSDYRRLKRLLQRMKEHQMRIASLDPASIDGEPEELARLHRIQLTLTRVSDAMNDKSDPELAKARGLGIGEEWFKLAKARGEQKVYADRLQLLWHKFPAERPDVKADAKQPMRWPGELAEAVRVTNQTEAEREVKALEESGRVMCVGMAQLLEQWEDKLLDIGKDLDDGYQALKQLNLADAARTLEHLLTKRYGDDTRWQYSQVWTPRHIFHGSKDGAQAAHRERVRLQRIQTAWQSAVSLRRQVDQAERNIATQLDRISFTRGRVDRRGRDKWKAFEAKTKGKANRRAEREKRAEEQERKKELETELQRRQQAAKTPAVDPVDWYLTLVDQNPDDTDLVTGSLLLAEDRILSYAAVVRTQTRTYTAYEPRASFYFQATAAQVAGRTVLMQYVIVGGDGREYSIATTPSLDQRWPAAIAPAGAQSEAALK